MEEPKKRKKVNGKRNRTAGHNYELELVHEMHKAGYPHAGSSRALSRRRDNEGIDICNADELVNGRLPYNISAKNLCTPVKYAKLLEAMPKIDGVINAVAHKFTQYNGHNYSTRGKFVIMSQEDFFKLIKTKL